MRKKARQQPRMRMPRMPRMNSRPVTPNTLKRVGSNLFEQVSRISRRIHSMAYCVRTGQYLSRIRLAEKE